MENWELKVENLNYKFTMNVLDILVLFYFVFFWAIFLAIKLTLFQHLDCSSASLCLTLSNKLGIHLNYLNGLRAAAGQGKS